MRNQRENLVRGAFSFLAAGVTLGMAQEWASWAIEQRQYWKLLPAAGLTIASVYEAHKVWNRAERIMGLTYE